MAVLRRLFSWLLRKLGFGLLLALLGLSTLGLWTYFRDPVDFARRREELVRTLTGEVTRLELALAETGSRMAATRVEIAAQEERAVQAARVARELDSLNSGLSRLMTESAQVHENAERLARMQQMEAGARRRTAELTQTLTRTQWEKDGLEIALARVQSQLKSAKGNKSQTLHYARATWSAYGLPVLFATALIMVGLPFLERARIRRAG